MSTKDGLIDLKAIIEECVRIKELFPRMLLHNTIGKNIDFYSNVEHSYHTITIYIRGGEMVKVTFSSGNITSISINSKYLNYRSLNSIVKRLKKVKVTV